MLATGLVLSVHAAPPVVISEFVATNVRGLKDAKGGTPDWIELHNRSGAPVDLGGYRLTDNVRRPDKWVLPSVSIRSVATTQRPSPSRWNRSTLWSASSSTRPVDSAAGR